MSFPLCPLFSSIFLSYHETPWLNTCPSECKPAFCRHCVNDCFVLFSSGELVLLFLTYFNSQHRNIFTHELETNNSLFFLYIKISSDNGCLSTSFYRKTTFTGLFTNFENFIPLIYKKDLIFFFLYRCFKLRPMQLLTLHWRKLKKLFLNNDCPANLFDYCVPLSLDKTFAPPRKSSTAPKLAVYLSLPFTDTHRIQIRTHLLKLFSSAYPEISLWFVFGPVRCLSRTAFPVASDHPFIYLSVNAAWHCMHNKHFHRLMPFQKLVFLTFNFFQTFLIRFSSHC